MTLLRGEMQLCLILMPLKKHDDKDMRIAIAVLAKGTTRLGVRLKIEK